METTFQVAKYLLEKDLDDAFYRSRDAILETVKVGVIALKRGKAEVVKEVKRKIAEFEKAFKKKYKPPKGAMDRISLLDKTVGWRSDLGRMHSFLDLGDKLLHETVNYEDITKFIAEVWNVQVTVTEMPVLEPKAIVPPQDRKTGKTS